MPNALRRPLTPHTLHLCVDMQRLFSPEGPWPTPWMPRVLPVIKELASWAPRRNLFARFIPPEKPADMPGKWQDYYERWRQVTREFLDPALLELMPELAALCPPGTTVDRSRYSVFSAPTLVPLLRERQADGIIISGAETDVCVLATTLDAVDLGIRVIVVSDALCSSSDPGHDALIGLYQHRFSEQIEVADTLSVLSAWPREVG
jgi:nicotinamidase-related amidase